jgi:cation diffusion facilitator family transporter
MDDSQLQPHRHDHAFGQDRRKAGETKTMWVIALTATMMVVEVAAGIIYGSMALLADGLHMASHAAALSISAFAYIYARRHAHDKRYSFGTGKVNALAGFTGAILLAVFAILMAWESGVRLLSPVSIAFDRAILVAVIGLVVNGVSVVILGDGHHDHEDHKHHDQNLRSAYLHVMADALTSVMAIFALLAGKYFDQAWMDPAMGFVGAALITHWSIGLTRSTARVLLDRQGPEQLHEAVREAIEQHEGSQVTDLHLWAIGPNVFAVIITIVSDAPQTIDQYKAMLPESAGLMHVTIELHGPGS